MHFESTPVLSEPQRQFLPPASRIGMELVRDAVWHGDRCNWVGSWMDYLEGALTTASRTFGPDLYGGTSGIAFFLSALHTLEPDKLLRRTIEGAVNQALGAKDTLGRQGYFVGSPGVAYALIRCGERLEREDWVKTGGDMLSAVPAAQEHEIDVIGGAAGTIPVLLKIHSAYPRPALLDQAVQLGEFLCRTAHRSHAGWSWSTVPAFKDTTGYSHGAAGPATALLELFAATHDDRFREGAEQGYAYEQAHFDAGRGNWPDFRTGTGADAAPGSVFSMSWCHGAPGIALSRLRAFAITGREDYRQQAAAGLRTTRNDLVTRLQQGVHAGNFSLCHGLAGNADILLEAGTPDGCGIAGAVGAAGLENYHRPRLPWSSGLPGREKTPGLMMGLAGTGYFYLRLYDPRQFGTILLPAP